MDTAARSSDAAQLTPDLKQLVEIALQQPEVAEDLSVVLLSLIDHPTAQGPVLSGPDGLVKVLEFSIRYLRVEEICRVPGHTRASTEPGTRQTWDL